MKLSRDSLVGRVLEVSLGDLKDKGEDDAFRKIKLKVEEVSGSQCLTNFYGMDLTTDKLRSLVRKWHTLIEAHVDVKTTDGYLLRLFCIGLTKRRLNQIRKTSYAQTSQVRKIRKKMVEIMTREATSCDLQELVQKKFLPESIGREIDKATQVSKSKPFFFSFFYVLSILMFIALSLPLSLPKFARFLAIQPDSLMVCA